eukprot:CAMPEP_0185262918 /NCGR_PEP_ID=MMETSP1359-20130426/10935_1 /TAXON_ID=552665 /ORGANISM="Bigelowiella longifila, Strain CCMP242" /LENGTH=114 /DNA_ID=CAMNT_0027849989 /DNA_START=178 /DNA_END=522 /DNA_ORIENTATION=-
MESKYQEESSTEDIPENEMNNILGEEHDSKYSVQAYGSFRGGNHDDSRHHLAGFMKHEYRRRIRSPLDAGITAILFLSILGALVVGVVRPLLSHDSPLSRPLSQMFYMEVPESS